MGEDQRTLNGLGISPDALRAFIRKVLQEEGVLDPSQSRTVWSDYFPQARKLLLHYGYLSGHILDEAPELGSAIRDGNDRRHFLTQFVKAENGQESSHEKVALFHVPNRPGGIIVVAYESEKPLVVREINRQRQAKDADARPIKTASLRAKREKGADLTRADSEDP